MKLQAWIFLLSIVCALTYYFEKEEKAEAKSIPIAQEAIGYGNGVYYFSGNKPGPRISSFIGEHPELKVSAMSGDGTDMNGFDKGYFVVFEMTAKKFEKYEKKEVLVDKKVVEHGNGVYYFSCIGNIFGHKLSLFIEGHPELRVVAMSGDGTDMNGFDKGYFVVFEKR